jgi:hypothetical protein
MGRGWAILEGGNRGDVLKRSAAAVRYGDLSIRVAIWDEELCGGRGQDDPVISDEAGAAASVVSLTRAN